jgi:hypothetical protein
MVSKNLINELIRNADVKKVSHVCDEAPGRSFWLFREIP